MSEQQTIESMTTAEVMAALKIRKPDTLYKLVKAKRLRPVRIGREYRFDPDAVRAFIAGPASPKPARAPRQKIPAAPSRYR